MQRFCELEIPEVKVLNGRKFGDERGYFSETFSEKWFVDEGIDVRFVQDNQSLSAQKGTVRGLHMQCPPFAQAKLVRVNRGSIFDVAVDIRRGSPTYGRWVSAIITEKDWNQIFIPVGFLHGFVTLDENTEVQYKVSSLYHKESEAGVIWNDPELAIPWNAGADPILSEKDLALPRFADFESPFTYGCMP